MGVSTIKRLPQVSRERKQTLIFLGRVTKSKNIEDAICVLQKLKNSSGLQLWIVGKEDREYAGDLRRLVKKFGRGFKANTNQVSSA